MFTVKYIGVHDKKNRQQHKLLGGSEVNYEVVNYKRSEFSETIRNLIESGDNFTYIGIEPKDEKQKSICTLMFLMLFNGKEWKKYIIEDGWVYIMHNGKTIDKYDFINN